MAKSDINPFNPPREASAPPAPSASSARHVVMIGLCAAATIAYVQRNSIGVAEGVIRDEFGLSKVEMGRVIGAFFLTYAIAQLPTGWLGHVLGSRRGLTLFSTVWSLCTAAMALTTSGASLFMVRLGMGAAQAGVFPCCANTMAGWIPSTRRGTASGALGAFMSVGGVIGAALTGVLVVTIGWRWTFASYALPGLLWAVWFGYWFRDRPGQHRSVNQAELDLITGSPSASPQDADLPDARRPAGKANDAPTREPTPWGQMLSSRSMLWIGGQQFFRAAGYIFYASWFPDYLKETYKVSTTESGFLTSLPIMAVAVGSLLGGRVCDAVLQATGSRRMARQGVAFASMILCALLILAAYFVQDVLPAVLLISLGSFCAAFAGPCAYTITIDLGGRHVTMVFSFMNMCGNIAAVLLPVLLPYVPNQFVLFGFGGVYVAAAVCWVSFDAEKEIFKSREAKPAA